MTPENRLRLRAQFCIIILFLYANLTPEEGPDLSQQQPTAYHGDQPYVFISYAHKDSDVVLPIIDRLQRDGYRVWYDEGIPPGSNWDEYISEHLDRCANVLGFLSKAYVKSHNCRDELALTRQKGKPMHLVYVDDVELSPGLKMRYGRIQALFLQKMPEAEFFQRLYRHGIQRDVGLSVLP